MTIGDREVFNRLVLLIHKVLQTSREKDLRRIPDITLETDIYNDLGIDSLEIMDVLAAVEREFCITIEMEKAAKLHCVGDLTDYLEGLIKGAK